MFKFKKYIICELLSWWLFLYTGIEYGSIATETNMKPSLTYIQHKHLQQTDLKVWPDDGLEFKPVPFYFIFFNLLNLPGLESCDFNTQKTNIGVEYQKEEDYPYLRKCILNMFGLY